MNNMNGDRHSPWRPAADDGWTLGEPAIEAALGPRARAAKTPGLAVGALHEVVAADCGDWAAACGFACALLIRRLRMPAAADRPALVVGCRLGFREQGRISGRGLAALGGDPGRLLLAAAERVEDALWAAEEGLRSGALAAVVVELVRAEACDLAVTRRLQLAARAGGTPVILLTGAARTASAARSRWQVACAPSRPPAGDPQAPGRPCWRLRLEKGWRERPGSWLVEWDDASLSCRLAAPLAAHPASLGQPQAKAPDDTLRRAG